MPSWATRAAFAIRQRTEQLNEEYGGIFPPVGLHMGINTGNALVGATKIGGSGSQRWTFTATGPTTNVAARFAGSAQAGEIVVGPTTADRIKAQFVLESVGERTFLTAVAPAFTELVREGQRLYVGGTAELLDHMPDEQLGLYRGVLATLEKRAALLEILGQALDPRRPC